MWNEQCDRFRFSLPDGWRSLTDEEIRWLGHEEECRVWAGAIAGAEDDEGLVHVTIVPGQLEGYVEHVLSTAWGESSHVTQVGGPYVCGVGGADGALLEYACLDYDPEEDPASPSPPRHKALLLVIVGIENYLYRISLYAPEERLARYGPEFQAMLDSWLWADLLMSAEDSA